MLKRSDPKVTFVLPDEHGSVSVVGDFNGWDPLVHPLRKRSNGTRSIALELPEGTHAFRYPLRAGRQLMPANSSGR